jgi:hypothetical protein
VVPRGCGAACRGAAADLSWPGRFSAIARLTPRAITH